MRKKLQVLNKPHDYKIDCVSTLIAKDDISNLADKPMNEYLPNTIKFIHNNNRVYPITASIKELPTDVLMDMFVYYELFAIYANIHNKADMLQQEYEIYKPVVDIELKRREIIKTLNKEIDGTNI